MNMLLEDVDYSSTDFDSTESDLRVLSEPENISIDINKDLENAILELRGLKERFSANESAMLIELCKDTVIETITGQFGLASMFIEAKDGGSVTTTHNFEKGIVANEKDRQKYSEFKANNDGTRKWDNIRKSAGYDKPLKNIRKEAFKNNGEIVDAYTGRPLPKDGRAHLDHIVSAKEIESNMANHLHMSPEQRAKMATSEKNLAWTEGSANQSKGEQKMEEWLQKREKSGQTKSNEYDIDNEKALKEDANARNFVKVELTKTAVKNYTNELLRTGGKDATMIAAYSAFGAVMRDFTQTVFIEIHVTLRECGNESFAAIFKRFKDSLSTKMLEIGRKWKDILAGGFESGLTAFLSNALVFIINLFATTLKKVVSMIRAGFVSLVKAAKMLINPPAGMSKEEAGYQAVKILTAGLIGAASMGLDAGIEKLLQSIPGLQALMMFQVPVPGKEPRTVSDVVATILSALIGGLITTITLYFMDRCRESAEKEKLQIQIAIQSNIVAQYKVLQTWVSIEEAYKILNNTTADFICYLSGAVGAIQESEMSASIALSNLADANTRLKAIVKRLEC